MGFLFGDPMSPSTRNAGKVVLAIILSLSTASPVLAASRSKMIDVSCVIKPVFQISSPALPAANRPVSETASAFTPAKRSELGVSGNPSGISVQSNQIHTRVNTEIRKQSGMNVKFYSVTVL
jgi:hypothetical protein